MIVASNVIVMGTISGMPLYTNTVGANNLSNIDITSDLSVAGSVFTTQRMDCGMTMFATFRQTSNLSFANSSEVFASSNTFTMDFTSTDMSGMSAVDPVVPPNNVYSVATGRINVPVSGLYTLEMQGKFTNSVGATNVQNGVYYRFLNHPYPSARVGAQFTSGSMVSTSMQIFLLGGDVFLPTFYSNDAGATLDKTDGETYVKFALVATVTPQHNNYTRVPLLNYP
jgi:hypothetical protein